MPILWNYIVEDSASYAKYKVGGLDELSVNDETKILGSTWHCYSLRTDLMCKTKFMVCCLTCCLGAIGTDARLLYKLK